MDAQRTFQGDGPKLVMIFCPKNDQMYHEVKFYGETEIKTFGYCTQIISENNVSNKIGKGGIEAYISNVLLKINVKLGGINQIVDPVQMPAVLKKSRVMVIGADVTHAAHEQGFSSKSVPYSLAALCASYDDKFIKYYTTARVQEKLIGEGQQSQEMITSIDEMFIESIKNFHKHNGGKLPDHIVYYRDGVSEGQFQTVLNEEIGRISGTFGSIGEKAKVKFAPKITLVIVGKRHHTRIRPEFENDGVGENKEYSRWNTCGYSDH